MPPNSEDYIEIAQRRAEEKKTHVSFPQLKYPSLRDTGLKDVVQWLKGKQMDDGAEGLWRVHDKLYDFSEFMKRHPGGEEWLELSEGTDITEAFEAHHLNPTVKTLLSKFYVRDAKTPRNSPFTFKEDGFFLTLRQAIYEELKNIPESVTRKSDMIIDGIFATCLISSALSCYLTNYWAVMACYIIASVSLAWTTVASHNYIHRRTNWRMYLFNVCAWSYRDFRISHVLSHHLYPNTLMDIEITGFEPIILWNPRKKTLISKFAILIEQFIFPAVFLINWTRKFFCNFYYEGFFSRHFRWHDMIGLMLPIWIYVASGASFYDSVIMWLWINCTSSTVFFNIGSNAAHHHPDIFKDGDELSETTLDWGMHELNAVMDRKDINGNLFRVMTFFGDHALHHLFPTLDHALLPYLYPTYLEHCKKFNANYQLGTQFELIVGQIKSTMKTEPNVLKKKE